MKTKNIIMLIMAIVIVSVLVYAGIGLTSTSENNTTDNISINISNNDTNNTTQTQENVTKKTKAKNTKSDSPSIVSDNVEYNYQADDGSYYRQVEYSDGNFRQIDMSGKIIGSSYPNDHVEGESMV